MTFRRFKSRINASQRIADIAYARGLLARFEQATSEVVLVTPNIFLRNERLSARSARKRVEHPFSRSAYARRKNLVVYA